MTALTDAPPIENRPLTALPTGRARTIALFSLFLASTMELLDTTIVNVALPSIATGLGATAAQLQWMVAAYPLAFAVALITGSRLGDLWGRKRLFVVGLVGFTADVRGLRAGPERRGAHRVPCPAGAGRRGDDPAGPHQHPGHVCAARAGRRHGPVHGAGRRDRGPRAGAGCGPHQREHRRHRLALDLPRQRAGRHRRDRRRCHVGARTRSPNAVPASTFAASSSWRPVCSPSSTRSPWVASSAGRAGATRSSPPASSRSSRSSATSSAPSATVANRWSP